MDAVPLSSVAERESTVGIPGTAPLHSSRSTDPAWWLRTLYPDLGDHPWADVTVDSRPQVGQKQADLGSPGGGLCSQGEQPVDEGLWLHALCQILPDDLGPLADEQG